MAATAPQFRIQRHESPTRAQLDLARDIWAARQRATSVDQRHRHALAGGGVAGHVGVASYSPMLRKPAGATKLFPWDAETEFRHFLFTGSSRVRNTRTAGSSVKLPSTSLMLTVEVARRLAQALIDVADQAEQMNGNDQIGASENR